MIRGAVVDASAALAWVLPGEFTEPALRLRDPAVAEPTFALLVPPTFWYEVANALWAPTRQNRMDRPVAFEALEALWGLAFEVWEVDPRGCLELALLAGAARAKGVPVEP